jgi:DNA-binding NarL/FixJ family response regulator
MASVTLPDGQVMALSGEQDPKNVLRLLAAGAARD